MKMLLRAVIFALALLGCYNAVSSPTPSQPILVADSGLPMAQCACPNKP
jgi:hypothetical protein